MPTSSSRPSTRNQSSDSATIESQDRSDYQTIHGMKDKLHEYRMQQIRENLEQERKKAWIYVGNAFRQPPTPKQ